jgi:hypothetical protein
MIGRSRDAVTLEKSGWWNHCVPIVIVIVTVLVEDKTGFCSVRSVFKVESGIFCKNHILHRNLVPCDNIQRECSLLVGSRLEESPRVNSVSHERKPAFWA